MPYFTLHNKPFVVALNKQEGADGPESLTWIIYCNGLNGIKIWKWWIKYEQVNLCTIYVNKNLHKRWLISLKGVHKVWSGLNLMSYFSNSTCQCLVRIEPTFRSSWLFTLFSQSKPSDLIHYSSWTSIQTNILTKSEYFVKNIASMVFTKCS